MAARAFFGPPQPDNETAVSELKLYITENDQLQHQHPAFQALQTASSSFESPAHAHTLSSSSHELCPSSSHAACSDPSYEAHHHHIIYPRPHDHLHHQHPRENHHGHLHLLDELRTCAKLKAEIVAHPLFDDLLQAHVQCLSVGVSEHYMQAMEAQLAKRHSIVIKYLMLGRNVNDQGAVIANAVGCRREIDAFMENYLQLLLSWKEQLDELVSPPTIKALSTLCEIKQAFLDLTGSSFNEISSGMTIEEDDTCLYIESDASECAIESQDDLDRSLYEHIRVELKSKLKDSYRENIQAMREEILRKRQAGKLPGDITAMKKWWNTHSRWPYPSEEDKRKLMEETGLEMRQINNWFINHRKRNWSNRQPPPPPTYTSNAASAGSSSLQQQG